MLNGTYASHAEHAPVLQGALRGCLRHQPALLIRCPECPGLWQGPTRPVLICAALDSLQHSRRDARGAYNED